MRWRIAVVVLAVLAVATACSRGPGPATAGGVPQSWYTTVDKALADQPNVGSVGQLEDKGRCPLRKDVKIAGKKISDLSDHGVVRLGGDTPAVLCSWFEDLVVDVEVAHAPDAARYAKLVAGTHAVEQPGNRQTEKDVTIGAHTVRVVRTVFPTNPSAGTNLSAALLDEGSRGRVRLEVDGTQALPGYDEQAVAADLVTFLGG